MALLADRICLTQPVRNLDVYLVSSIDAELVQLVYR
jgi:hypothetical protein